MSRWAASACVLLDAATSVSEGTFRELSPVICVHIDAFVKHSRWVPRLQQWCIMMQAAMVDEAMRLASQHGTISSIDAETLSFRWKKSKCGGLIKRLCSSIVRAMTIVNKRCRRPIIEKGHPVFLALASGELAPVVLEMLAQKNLNHQSSGVMSLKDISQVSLSSPVPSSDTSTIAPVSSTETKLPSSQKVKATVKKTLLDYLKMNDSPASSDIEDVTASTMSSTQTVKPTYHKTSHSSGLTSSGLTSTFLVKPWISKRTNKGAYELFSSSKKRDGKDSFSMRKTGNEGVICVRFFFFASWFMLFIVVPIHYRPLSELIRSYTIFIDAKIRWRCRTTHLT